MADKRALHHQTVRALIDNKHVLATIRSLVGFDGFVDEIVHLVDKRASKDKYTTIKDLSTLARRIEEAAGQSTNIEMVVRQVKIGGNGPIMANALAALGFPLTYIGILGHPAIHPVFAELDRRAKIVSLGEPAHTDALEFDDGKIMLGKMATLHDITWATLLEKVGHSALVEYFSDSQLIVLVNWTMTPHMSDIWRHLLDEVCPQLAPAPTKRWLFFDLADPEKRTTADLKEALSLIGRFEQFYQVVLGLNEKEGNEIAEVLELPIKDDSPQSLQRFAADTRERLRISAVVIHPREYAVAASAGETTFVAGPFTSKPLISTGAGDHFNAGFCLGIIMNLPLESCLLAGVTASGYYVRTGKSPSAVELVHFIENWPSE